MSRERPLLEVVRHPLRMRMLEVVAVERPTPRLVRVSLAGDDLRGFRSDGSADHVKVFFPRPGETVATVPDLGPDGIVGAPGRAAVRGRDYTPKHQRLDDGVLQLDVVLHAGGLGSAWAERAAVGEVLGVAGPRGSHVLRDDVEALVLVGDETALPAMQNFAFRAPPSQRVVAVIEADDERDVQPFGPAEGPATWVFRRGSAPGSPAPLLDAVAGLALPPGRVLHWVAGEADVVRALRAHLARDRGVEPAHLDCRGYWKLGAADHQEPHDD